MPQDETPSGIRVNWKAKAERLETECVALGQSCAAVTDRYNTIRAELDAVRIVAGQHLNLIDGLEQQIKIHESEISRLETVISERANTIERLTVGIDQYQKDIAVHVATADDRDAYVEELKGKIQELEGLAQVAAQQYDRALNSKEAQNAAARIMYQADGEYYRSQIIAYKRDVARVPRWLRRLFLSSHMQDGDQ